MVMVIASDELLECRVTPNGGQTAHYQWLVSKWHCSLWDRPGRTGQTCRQTGCCHDKSHPAIFFLDDLRGRFQLCALMVRGSSSVDRRISTTLPVVVWPTMSCFADWSKSRHVTLNIIICSYYNVTPGEVTWCLLNANVRYIILGFCLRLVSFFGVLL